VALELDNGPPLDPYKDVWWLWFDKVSELTSKAVAAGGLVRKAKALLGVMLCVAFPWRDVSEVVQQLLVAASDSRQQK
jgi:hypothetical protein